MSSRLSAEECRRAMEGLAPQIERYAELLVHKGAAIKPGQELVLQAPVERADFVRIVVKAAYRAVPGTSPSSGAMMRCRDSPLRASGLTSLDTHPRGRLSS